MYYTTDEIATLIDKHNSAVEKLPYEHEYLWLEYVTEQEYLERSMGSDGDLGHVFGLLVIRNEDNELLKEGIHHFVTTWLSHYDQEEYYAMAG